MTNNKENPRKKPVSEAESNFAEEMIEIDQLPLNNKKTYNADDEKASTRRHKRRIRVGAIFSLLALVGVLSMISGMFNIGKGVFDNSGEKQKLNSLLAPLVMYDPLPFEKPEEADQRILLASSVWATIMNSDMEQYEKDAYAQIYLPAVDVDTFYAKVFGTKTKLTHQTFDDQDMKFEFDEEKQAYIVPPTSFPSGFTPQVFKIKRGFSEKIVTVGYLSPQTSWADTNERTVSKYVDYVFHKQDGQFCLVAVRESAKKVEAPATTPTPVPETK
ncbi:MAG: hypothetical protein RR253_05305 [Oscillospiraceae bacterium]